MMYVSLLKKNMKVVLFLYSNTGISLLKIHKLSAELIDKTLKKDNHM